MSSNAATNDEVANTAAAANRNIVLERATLTTMGSAERREYPNEFEQVVELSMSSMTGVQARLQMVADALVNRVRKTRANVAIESLPVTEDDRGPGAERRYAASTRISIATPEPLNAVDDLIHVAGTVADALNVGSAELIKEVAKMPQFADNWDLYPLTVRPNDVRFWRSGLEKLKNELRRDSIKAAREAAIEQAAAAGMKVVQMLRAESPEVPRPVRVSSPDYAMASAAAFEVSVPHVSLQRTTYTDSVACTWEIASRR